MADTKITGLLSPQVTTNPATDVLPIVNIADTLMASSGSTRKITVNQLLGAGGTATLASATISGDLTVDTNVLKVDTTNNRVTVGTTSAYGRLTVGVGSGLQAGTTTNVASGLIDIDYATTGNINTRFSFVNSNGVTNAAIDRIGNPNVNDSGNLAFLTRSGAGSLTERYRIAADGVATWSEVGGTSGTAMTLNATGLGVGASPSYKLSVAGTANIGTIGTAGRSLLIASSAADNITIEQTNNGSGSHTFDIKTPGWSTDSFNVYSGSTIRLKLTGDGNLGIGVTPSAWGSGTSVIDLNTAGNAGAVSSSGTLSIASNAFFDGTNWTYKNNAAALLYQLISGTHRWFTAGASTGTITDFATAKMTLDGSGRLLVGKTTSGFTTVGAEIRENGEVIQTIAASTDATFVSKVYSSTAAAYRFYVGLGGTVFATNTTISSISDARLKENVQDLDVGLGAILALKPRKFDWKAGKGKDIKGDRGFIAQEFEQVFPNLIDEWADPAPEGEASYKSVRQDLIPVLVKAIQELAAEVNALKKA